MSEKLKKTRVIWVVCEKEGGTPQGDQEMVYAYKDRTSCLNACVVRVDKPVKFVEAK